MRLSDVNDSLQLAHIELQEKGLTQDLCEFSEGVQAFLRQLESRSGILEGIGLRAAHGWITDWRRDHC